jgi:hypothetical protein
MDICVHTTWKRSTRVCVGHRRPRCRGDSMALEHMCASIGDPSTYALIHIAACARASGDIGGAAAHNGRACVDDRPSAVRRGARRAESGAYAGQARDGGGVPRADVGVKSRRRLERLRAENATLGGGGKCSHALARMRARPRTHTSARVCTRASASTWRTTASAIRAYDDRRTGQGVCMYCIRIPIHRCVTLCVSPWL